jgi:Co/Zn/Cd efflux system component
MITNADSMLSMFISLVYVLYYGRIVKLSCKYLSQAVPSTIDIEKCKEDIENLVRSQYFYIFSIIYW